ncbi:hypothetical protein OH77DRAFT_601149 [Trametes cingulata]|nr:hypothetical protein OH77DRAFT_601149 [Trametes cingulata]
MGVYDVLTRIPDLGWIRGIRRPAGLGLTRFVRYSGLSKGAGVVCYPPGGTHMHDGTRSLIIGGRCVPGLAPAQSLRSSPPIETGSNRRRHC